MTSSSLSNLNGTQSFGSVSCPSGLVAWGGGVIGSSVAVGQDINSSYPAVSFGVATGWQAFINNNSGANASFTVYAVCASMPTHYSVQSATYQNPTGGQTIGANAACPLTRTGKPFKALGGGAFGSGGLGQNFNSSLPIPTGWRIDMNNVDGFTDSITTYVICGKAAGYKQVHGAAADNPNGLQTSVFQGCPIVKGIQTVPTGGGALSGSASPFVDMNGTAPDGNGWISYEDNFSGGDASITPYAACVK